MDVDVIAISSSDEERDKEEGSLKVHEPLLKKMKMDAEVEVIQIISDDENHPTKEIEKSCDLPPGDSQKEPRDPQVSTKALEHPAATVPTIDPSKEEDSAEVPRFFKQFVDDCIGTLNNEKLIAKAKSKCSLLYRAFRKAGDYNSSDEFKELIEEYTANLKELPNHGIRYFYDAFKHLQQQNNSQLESGNYVKKLYKLLTKLSVRINKLEETYDDDDVDDDTSNYIQLQRYRERATRVYAKIMELEESDPHSGRLYFARLDYASSKHPDINRAINKKFKCRKKIAFPTFDEVNKCVRSCVEENDNLKSKLSESAICREVQFNFEHLGNLIQRKRKQDLAYIHFESYLSDSVDPALNDPVLEEKLRNNKLHGEKKLNSTFQKYSDKEWDTNKVLSEDSDDSHIGSDDNENTKDEEK